MRSRSFLPFLLFLSGLVAPLSLYYILPARSRSWHSSLLYSSSLSLSFSLSYRYTTLLSVGKRSRKFPRASRPHFGLHNPCNFLVVFSDSCDFILRRIGEELDFRNLPARVMNTPIRGENRFPLLGKLSADLGIFTRVFVRYSFHEREVSIYLYS